MAFKMTSRYKCYCYGKSGQVYILLKWQIKHYVMFLAVDTSHEISNKINQAALTSTNMNFLFYPTTLRDKGLYSSLYTQNKQENITFLLTPRNYIKKIIILAYKKNINGIQT